MNPVFIIAIILFITANGFLIFKTVKTCLDYTASQNWIETIAQVENIEYQKVVESEGNGIGVQSISYDLYLTYSYKVMGQIFTRDLIKTVYSEDDIDAVRIGDLSTIYVDPEEPDQAWEERGNIIDIFGVIAALFVANIIGAGILHQINSFFTQELS